MNKDACPVLVIDDDPGIRSFLIDVLHGKEYTVVAVASAEEGLAQLPYLRFGVAFVDHHLPRMDGITLCGYLRRANPLIDVVMITGEENPSLRKAAESEGIHFLQKPLSVDQILQIVEETREALEQHAAATDTKDPFFAPRLGPLLDEAAVQLGLPAVPARLRETLVRGLKSCVSRLRSRSRFSEKERVMLFAGILTARLLGITLPLAADGRSLAEEYDRLMLRMGKRAEFGQPPSEKR